jgi:hypothetical protein
MMKALVTEGAGFIEKQAEDPSLSRDGMNAVPTAFETEAKSISI